MSDWTPKQEERIAEIMKANGGNRSNAVRQMRGEELRAAKSKSKLAQPKELNKVLAKLGDKAPHVANAKKAKAKGEAKISKGDAKHYDQQRVIEMFLAGKTIAECAAAQKPMSTVYAHRILTTKVPKEYAAEQARRKAAREKAAQ